MKKLTKTIYIVVILASLVSVIGFLLLVRTVENITVEYQELVDEQMTTLQMMNKLSNHMYQIQAAASEMVVQVDQSNYEEYEKMISNSKKKIDELLSDLSRRIEDNESQDLIHKVNQDYQKYMEQVEIAERLCEEGLHSSAVYYVSTIMESYLNSANSNISIVNEELNKEVDEASQQMKVNSENMYKMRNVLILAVLFSIILCILITYYNGRKIVNTQILDQENHIERLIDMQDKIVIGMANLIESRDGETGEHVKRTSDYVKMLCEQLIKDGQFRDILTEQYCSNLYKAAPLHDIGKIKVPDRILQKPGKLTDEEFEIIKYHTIYGGEMIPVIVAEIEEAGYLEIATDVAMYHHEKWNGCGYPKNLSGEEIPLSARIMAVADVFDALVSKRCYKEPFEFDKAYEIVEESSGSHFDPIVVKAFVNLKEEVRAYLNA